MNTIIRQNGITYGIVSGLLSILLLTVIYATNVNLFISGWITFLKFSLFTTVAILLLLKTKKQFNGTLNFKETFTTYFLFSCISLLVTTIFEIVLFNFIDPELKDTLKELTIKFTAELLRKFNTPAGEISNAIQKIKENDQFSISELLKGYFTYLVISAIFGLILAAIFKTKQRQDF